jgi:L-ascorbate metabolism protein UlaG (beta-lactamase superfamily)
MLHPRHAAGHLRMNKRRALKILLALAVLVPLGLGLAGFAGPVPRHDGQATANFDGERFFNTPPFEKRFGDFLRWQLNRDRGRWDTDLVPTTPPTVLAPVPRGATRVTWVNHATVLIQAGPVNILTDPIWSDRASPFSWAGPKRHLLPGLAFEALPRIDVVLVSHNHFDHMDLATLERLMERHRPRFLVPLGNCVYLEDFAGDRCEEMDWWESRAVSEGISVTAVPARHWSRRGLFDTNRALWAGWVIEGSSRVYFAGDTGLGEHFAGIRSRLGPPDLAILPIGAYLPRWFMKDQHLSPADAIEAARALGAGRVMAVHHGTFELADDGQWEALETLRAELEAQPGEAGRFWLPAHGDAHEWPAGDRVADR